MANEILKQVFQEMHSDIATSVTPDSIVDVLFSKKVIVQDDYDRLREVTVKRDRCRDLLSMLHRSAHPQVFIHLRLALLDEYSWLVDNIDKLLTSPSSQLQKLRLSDSSNGKRLLLAHEST